MLTELVPLSPALVWGLFARGLGFIFLISFWSLAVQIVRASGSKGGLPVARRLEIIARDFPTWHRFHHFPTLLWVNSSDAMLRGLALVGMAAAAYAIYGGPYSQWALLTCYLCYLSLDLAIGLIFPWDSFLFEAGVLGLFLPATLALPSLEAVATPAPALAWAYRLLLFRVMFGFGKQKFIGSTNKDWAYLKGFLIAQPLPSKLGWYMQKLPGPLLKLLVVAMFIVEVPMPFFAFFPGDSSVLCALSTAGLMVGIQAMGSFGYFSLLTIVGCIPLLDQLTPTQLSLTEQLAWGSPHFAATAFILVHTVFASIAFLFNSWVAQSWHLWSVWFRLPPLAQIPLHIVRFLHPFRWLHPYGVFPPNTGPGVKGSLLLEVTWDKQTWHTVDFQFSPNGPHSPPLFIAPYHPRGDQAVIYETFGLNPTSLISSMVGPWDPYSFGSQPAATTLLQCIVEGRGAMFMKAGSVLEQHKEPPVQARVSTVLLEPVSLKEHRATGAWWKRTYIGPHSPPRDNDPRFWDELLPHPEMWHFDAIYWRRNSKFHALMERSRAGEDPLQLALADAPELSQADVDRFWNELVPLVGLDKRVSFDTLPDVVAAVRARFDRAQQRALYRLLGRFAFFLVARVEPLYLGRWLTPEVPAKTYFHIVMAAHHILGQGKDAYLAAMQDPKRAVTQALSELTPQTGLYYQSIFRFENMIFDAQKIRLVTAITPPHDPAQKARIANSTEHLTDFERTLARWAENTSGYFSIMPTIRNHFRGPRFDQGYPELYPTFKQLDDGEVVLDKHEEPPQGVVLPGTPQAAE